MLKYSIKPSIVFAGKDLWIFNNELLDMEISAIRDGVESFESVLNDSHAQLNWGHEVFEMIIGKEKTELQYHGKKVTEISTTEMLHALKDYISSFEKLNG